MISAAIAWFFVGLAVLNWAAVGLNVWLVRQDGNVRSLRRQLFRFVMTALGASGFGVLGLAHLAGANVRLTGAGAILLLVACALTCWGPPYYLITFFLPIEEDG